MSIVIYHVIDSLGIGGGQAMLFELYESLGKLCPDWRQEILLFSAGGAVEDFVKSYGRTYTKSSPAILEKLAPSLAGRCVVIYHKLMQSKTEQLRSIYNQLPVLCINHTHSDSQIYNKIRYADKVIAVCHGMAKNLKKHGVRQPVSTIHNGVDGEKYHGVESRIRDDNDVLLTGRINSLNSIKYSDSWSAWCSKLNLPKVMVHEYMGSGPFFKQAGQYIAALGRQRNKVKLLGPISNLQDKIARIKSWDVFLYEINRNEGVSIAVLEAMACGVPVICSDHFGNNEIIKDGINGFVFKNRAEAHNYLTELCLNPDIIQELKDSTLKYFKDHLDAKVMAGKYRSEILELLPKTRPVLNVRKPDVIQKSITKSTIKITSKKKIQSTVIQTKKSSR